MDTTKTLSGIVGAILTISTFSFMVGRAVMVNEKEHTVICKDVKILDTGLGQLAERLVNEEIRSKAVDEMVKKELSTIRTNQAVQQETSKRQHGETQRVLGRLEKKL